MIRDGLRALEDREKLRALKLEALRADIQQGINSGPSRPLQQVNVELQAYSARAELGVGLRCCVHQRYVIFFKMNHQPTTEILIIPGIDLVRGAGGLLVCDPSCSPLDIDSHHRVCRD